MVCHSRCMWQEICDEYSSMWQECHTNALMHNEWRGSIWKYANVQHRNGKQNKKRIRSHINELKKEQLKESEREKPMQQNKNHFYLEIILQLTCFALCQFTIFHLELSAWNICVVFVSLFSLPSHHETNVPLQTDAPMSDGIMHRQNGKKQLMNQAIKITCE